MFIKGFWLGLGVEISGCRGFMKRDTKQILNIKKYIKNDVWDDFWKDIIDYEDLLEEPVILEKNYVNSQLRILDIPKPTKVLRPGHYITFLDRIYYFKLLLDFCYKIDKKLSKKTVSYSYRLAKNNSNFLENNIDNWLHFSRRQEEEFTKNPDWIMVETDITAFFEHIVIAKLANRIKILNEDAKNLNSLLQNWAGELPIGIPQGNDVSSYLANLYLDEVDKAMIHSGYIYFRFTDDIRIFVKDENEAEKSLIKLTTCLRPLNLHLNSSKTKLITKVIFEDEKNTFAQEMVEIEYGLEKDKIINLTENEKKDLGKKLKKVFSSSISKDSVNDRNFTFCINRFKQINSNHPLNKILKLEKWNASIVKTVCDYFIKLSLNNLPKVKQKIVEEYNKTNYEYVKIHLLRCLIFAKKDSSILDINYKDDLKSYNFLLRGYVAIFGFKFLDETKQNFIIDDIIRYQLHDHEFIRYVVIGSNFIINSHKRQNLQKIISSQYPNYSKLFDKNIRRNSNLYKVVNG